MPALSAAADAMLDQSVEQRIRPHLEGAFEQRLFEAALNNLADKNNPLRFNNFAYSIRELVRHVLARLTADDRVRRCPWFRQEAEREGQVTRRQRAAYAVHGGLQPTYVVETLYVELAEPLRALVEAQDVLSKHTHIEPGTFDLATADVARLSQETLQALAGFFDTMIACRAEVRRKLWDHVDRELVERVLSETIIDVDILATHHTVDGIDLGDVEVVAVDHERVHFHATGSLDVDLQWGRGDDAASLPESFPFVCQLSSPVATPERVRAEAGSIRVDTSSWFGED